MIITDAANAPDMSANKPIAFLWETFAAATLPPDCSEIQRDEMRKAFFAGAVGLYMQVMQSMTDAPGASMSEITFMVSLQKEIHEHLDAYRQEAISAFFSGLGLQAKWKGD